MENSISFTERVDRKLDLMDALTRKTILMSLERLTNPAERNTSEVLRSPLGRDGMIYATPAATNLRILYERRQNEIHVIDIVSYDDFSRVGGGNR